MLGRRWLQLRRSRETWALSELRTTRQIAAEYLEGMGLSQPVPTGVRMSTVPLDLPQPRPVTEAPVTSPPRPAPLERPRINIASALAVAFLIPMSAVGGVAVAVAQDSARYNERIYPGVSIAATNVGGLTRKDAAKALQAVASTRLSSPITLRTADERLIFTQAELGLRAYPDEAVEQAYAIARTGPPWQRLVTRARLTGHKIEIPLRIGLDTGVVLAAIEALASELEAIPQNAEVTVRDERVIVARPSQLGRILDVQATLERITAAVRADEAEVTAVVKIVEPAFTSEEASEIRAPLATYATVMGADANRIHNIVRASEFVRGTILPPGAVFSYNDAIGPRTMERGFKEAPVLIDDELVPGDGGGICQVSSTLFNVALLADMEIVSRVSHTRPVPYLPLGRDATAVYGALDFRFRNSTGHHVLLWAEVVGRRLVVAAYGTPSPGKEVAIEVTEHEEIPPPKHTVTKKDPELEVGQVLTREAQPGYRVKTYRVARVGGKVVRSDLIGLSYYRPVPRTIKIGIKPLAETRAYR